MLRGILAGVFLISIFPCAVNGAWLIDDFNEDGELVGSSPRSGGTKWIPKRKYPSEGSLFKAGGALRFDANSARDAEIDLAQLSDVTMYAGLSIRVTSVPTRPWLLPISFMGSNASGGDAIGRLFVSVGSTPQTFKVGVTNDADQVSWAEEELPAGKSIRLVLAFGEHQSLDSTQLLMQDGGEAVLLASTQEAEVTPYLSGIGLNLTNSDAVMSLDALFVSDSLQAALNYSDAPWLGLDGNSKRTTRQRRIRLRGAAWDCREVKKVEYRGGISRRFRRAKGTEQWQAVVRLKDGRNRIQVRAVGESGRKSPRAVVIVNVAARNTRP